MNGLIRYENSVYTPDLFGFMQDPGDTIAEGVNLAKVSPVIAFFQKFSPGIKTGA